MPTYEFVCPEGHTFDKFFRKISDSVPELPCPVCGEAATRKISGGAGLVFKGSGFYITDYGKDGKKAQNAPAKTKGKGSGDGGSTASGAASSASGGSTTPSKPSGSSE